SPPSVHLFPLCPSLFHDTAPSESYTLSLHDALPICGDDLALHGRSPPRPAVESRHLLIDHRRHLHDGEKQTLLLVAQRSDLVLIESRRDSVACSAVARAGDLVEQMTLGSRLTLETSDGCTQIVPGLQHGVAQGTRIVDAGGDARLATRVIISSHIRRR